MLALAFHAVIDVYSRPDGTVSDRSHIAYAALDASGVLLLVDSPVTSEVANHVASLPGLYDLTTTLSRDSRSGRTVELVIDSRLRADLDLAERIAMWQAEYPTALVGVCLSGRAHDAGTTQDRRGRAYPAATRLNIVGPAVPGSDEPGSTSRGMPAASMAGDPALYALIPGGSLPGMVAVEVDRRPAPAGAASGIRIADLEVLEALPDLARMLRPERRVLRVGLLAAARDLAGTITQP